MQRDPIVEEVRRIREAHAAKFDYDLAAICRDLRRQQQEPGRKVVSLSTQRIQPRARAASVPQGIPLG